ncbi:beta-ketoacyl-ACP synthase III [Desulfovibrio sp. X2]|uniref:beta-ketoacyl-ACP synthase III n=1 Tax=Desulfovibrio sp. X2 TaxID=941449 RepID=UPI0005542A09|nr:beta-ketoacyl-ACP synthase III [Desulfovibrio sp. X2]
MTNAYIRGTGFHVPDRILTNADLEKIVETSDEWITSRTGIKERHIAAKGEAASDLAAAAAKKALADAGMEAEELTHILVATVTPDCYTPACSCLVQAKLGLTHRIAMDLNAACSGFLYGLEQARAIVALKPEAKILLVGAEILTSRTNWEDRTTCVLFGDGAGAVIISGEPAPGTGSGRPAGRILDSLLCSDGSGADLLVISGGASSEPYATGQVVGPSHYIRMKGQDVFKLAVRSMESVCKDILARNGLSVDDVDLLIPHQANSRIIEAVGRKLGVAAERVFINVDRYGNTSAASVPIALAEARQQGRITEGSLVLLTAFGGGFTWGASLVRF